MFKNFRRKRALKKFHQVVSQRRNGELGRVDAAIVSIWLHQYPDFVSERFERGLTALHVCANPAIARVLTGC